jgi:hypothetical protein
MATNIMYNIDRGGGRSDRKNLVYNESLECFFSQEGSGWTQNGAKEGIKNE